MPLPKPPKGERVPGSGRPAGQPNRITREIRDAISKAFDEVGGADYLVKIAETKPEVFCGLVGKIIPREVDATGAMEIVYRIHRGVKPE